jgi:threonine/homoserine/homoserine lactone efflux protein
VRSPSGAARSSRKPPGHGDRSAEAFLLFLALLPQFTNPNAPWPVAIQIVTLGLVHVASCAVIYLVVGAGARQVLGARPGAARIVSRVSGAVMLVLAVVLLAEQFIH